MAAAAHTKTDLTNLLGLMMPSTDPKNTDTCTPTFSMGIFTPTPTPNLSKGINDSLVGLNNLAPWSNILLGNSVPTSNNSPQIKTEEQNPFYRTFQG